MAAGAIGRVFLRLGGGLRAGHDRQGRSRQQEQSYFVDDPHRFALHRRAWEAVRHRGARERAAAQRTRLTAEIEPYDL